MKSYTVVLHPDNPKIMRPVVVFAEDHERALIILRKDHPGVPFSNFIEMPEEGTLELVPGDS